MTSHGGEAASIEGTESRSALNNNLNNDINEKHLLQSKNSTTLNDFKIGAKIGAGTFGVIMRVEDKRTNKEYAFKMISKA